MKRETIASKYYQRKPIAEINVVPYIDVMLVLLVIFMVTAPLLTQGVEVDLPQAQAQVISDQDQEPLVVSIDAQGQYYLNAASQPDEPIAASTLLNRVAAELQVGQAAGYQRSVLVKGDRQVNYGAVVNLMALLQQAGVGSVGLMTQQPPELPPEQARNLAASLLPDIL